MPFDSDIPTPPLVSLLHRKQTAHINDKLKDVNLSSGLYPLLIKSYKNEGISQEELADALHVNESTVTRNLDKLEKKGLIIRTPKKRKKIISVTPEGAEIAKKVMHIDEKWDLNLKSSLTNEEYENFRKLLIKICEDLK
ncbi:MAG: MarR family transcriptional regulator [Methanobrevibacter sp.]|uniref:MarR family winged helix-turn-helix transcriptional regulator n=1 Tax=uncultured Methanobrevibacter sp. TaxID=253161 RepID=UPI0025CDB398|nr:MarR family transcriptional regulator [uncultured Methanobrevibacter sp.]MEE1128694.1 MarR family transcriptional regulator [Methanobrevibacter sp.]